VLTHISFEAAPAGRPLLAACDWLRDQQDRKKPDNNAPREVIDKAWQRYVVQKDGRVDIRAFTFCVLSHLQTAIHRRDIYTRPITSCSAANILDRKLVRRARSRKKGRSIAVPVETLF
jgi:hypothetical protein